MRGIDTYLALKEQVDLFTPRAAADLVAGDFLAFNSEGLSGRQQVIQSPAIRRQAMRNRAYSANGTMDASGSIEFTATNTVLDKLLGLAFHSKVGEPDEAADDGDGGTLPIGAVYTLVDGGALTPFTAFVGLDGAEGKFTRRFTGCKINSLSLSARVDSMLIVNADVAGVNKETLPDTVTPVYPGAGVEYGYVFSDASVLLKAGDMADLIELPVESFDITIAHNLSLDKYRLGSVYRRSLQEGITDVTGSFVLDAATRGVNGENLNLEGVGAHDPAFFERIAREARYAELRFTVVDVTREVEPGVPCSLTIDLPAVRLEEPDFNVRDAGILSGTARFTAYDSISLTHIANLS